MYSLCATIMMCLTIIVAISQSSVASVTPVQYESTSPHVVSYGRIWVELASVQKIVGGTIAYKELFLVSSHLHVDEFV
jgi:hypothetical protein